MRVVLISGKARHGKDTAAEILREELADRGERTLVTHYADLVKYVCRTFLGWDGNKDERGRWMLQYVGTDVVRSVEPDYWVDFVVSILTFFHDRWDYVIVPDTRFPNEIERIRDAGFETFHLRVVRPGFDGGLDGSAGEHISETALDNYPRDALIVNHGDGSYRDGIVELMENHNSFFRKE